jgi:D-alanyl-D-alanine carboxypeptidase (penicillin-binding protein 5/6)
MRAQRWPIDQWQQATRLIRWATRLPVGTAPVGTLVQPTIARPRVKPAAATASASKPAPHERKRPISTGPSILVLAVLVGAALYLSARLRRRS